MTLTSTGLDIGANIARVRERIAVACARCDRDPRGVSLVGVSKTVGPERILAAIAAGLTDLGENYVQEAATKRAAIGPTPARWHLIGRLQSNKARLALETFDIIQAVDSTRLAQALSTRAFRAVPIFLEVNVGGEASKAGLEPREVAAAVASITKLPNIDLRGLMTVAPAADDAEDCRGVFRTLRQLAAANGLQELSMGMSGDYEVAVQEGATIVRIGRAIFGERAP